MPLDDLKHLPSAPRHAKYYLHAYRISWMGAEVGRRTRFYHLHLANKKQAKRGTWVAQSVERPTSAQVVISQFMGLGPTLGSVLPACSLEPTSDSVSPYLSAPTLLTLCLSLKNK